MSKIQLKEHMPEQNLKLVEKWREIMHYFINSLLGLKVIHVQIIVTPVHNLFNVSVSYYYSSLKESLSCLLGYMV